MVDAPAPDAAPEPVQALTPANQNPWYVLATLHGEQPDRATPWAFDEQVHAKNRLTWNRWAAGTLRRDQLEAARAQRAGLHQEITVDEELTPFSIHDMAGLEDLWRSEWKRRNPFSTPIEIPDSCDTISLERVIFERLAVFSGFMFSADAWFQEAKFVSDSLFDDAVFFGEAAFENAIFSGSVRLNQACFLQNARFNGIVVSGHTSFSASNFYDEAKFHGSKFLGGMTFSSSILFKSASFAGSVFDRSVNFVNVRFSNEV